MLRRAVFLAILVLIMGPRTARAERNIFVLFGHMGSFLSPLSLSEANGPFKEAERKGYKIHFIQNTQITTLLQVLHDPNTAGIFYEGHSLTTEVKTPRLFGLLSPHVDRYHDFEIYHGGEVVPLTDPLVQQARSELPGESLEPSPNLGMLCLYVCGGHRFSERLRHSLGLRTELPLFVWKRNMSFGDIDGDFRQGVGAEWLHNLPLARDLGSGQDGDWSGLNRRNWWRAREPQMVAELNKLSEGHSPEETLELLKRYEVRHKLLSEEKVLLIQTGLKSVRNFQELLELAAPVYSYGEARQTVNDAAYACVRDAIETHRAQLAPSLKELQQLNSLLKPSTQERHLLENQEAAACNGWFDRLSTRLRLRIGI